MKQSNTRYKQSIESVVREILETAAYLEKRMDNALSMTRGITFSEFRMLRALAESNGNGLTRVGLAAELGVTASGVTRALKPLEKLGYVTTERNERDARQTLATLTRGGRKLFSDANGVVADVLAELGSRANDEKALAQVVAVLPGLRQAAQRAV